MQLAVDIGNTRVKCALFKDRDLISAHVSDKDPVYAIKDVFDHHDNIQAIIISSVREKLDPDLIPIPETIHHVILEHDTPVPIKNKYGSPETLGLDRIALAVSAYSLKRDSNCLVIDCGTCMTMEFINSNGEYLGGSISPGLKMRLRSMHEGTANLPLLEVEKNLPEIIGKSTEESMQNGTINGMLNEIIGAISRYESEFSDLNVLITGGDSELFENELKSGIFADPNLVLRGLNEILLYNIGKS